MEMDNRAAGTREVTTLAIAGQILLAIDIPGEIAIVLAPENPVIAWLARAVDTDYAPASAGFAFAQAISLVDVIWLMPLYFLAFAGMRRLRPWGFYVGLGCAPALAWNVMTDMATDLLGGFANVRSMPIYLALWLPYLVLPLATVAVLWRRRSLFIGRDTMERVES